MLTKVKLIVRIQKTNKVINFSQEAVYTQADSCHWRFSLRRTSSQTGQRQSPLLSAGSADLCSFDRRSEEKPNRNISEVVLNLML